MSRANFIALIVGVSNHEKKKFEANILLVFLGTKGGLVKW